jgi:hypothetical protein
MTLRDGPGRHESAVRSLAARLKRRRQKAAILPLNAGRLPHPVRYPVARQPSVPEASGGGIHIRRCGRASSIGLRPTRTTHARRADETSYSTGLVGVSAQLKQALVPDRLAVLLRPLVGIPVAIGKVTWARSQGRRSSLLTGDATQEDVSVGPHTPLRASPWSYYLATALLPYSPWLCSRRYGWATNGMSGVRESGAEYNGGLSELSVLRSPLRQRRLLLLLRELEVLFAEEAEPRPL